MCSSPCCLIPCKSSSKSTEGAFLANFYSIISLSAFFANIMVSTWPLSTCASSATSPLAQRIFPTYISVINRCALIFVVIKHVDLFARFFSDVIQWRNNIGMYSGGLCAALSLINLQTVTQKAVRDWSTDVRSPPHTPFAHRLGWLNDSMKCSISIVSRVVMV